MNVLADRTAVVTGGATGIGAGIAVSLAAAGAAVAVNHLGDTEKAGRIVERITADGGRAIPIQADITDALQVKRLFSEARSAFGPIDVLVNNAAVFTFQALAAVTQEEFHRQFDTNVLGPILTTQEFTAQTDITGGTVINIVSAGITLHSPNSALYTASKSALNTITKVAAKELAERGIRVNAIAPGGVLGENTRAAGILDGPAEAKMIAAIPLGRLGTPDDIGPIAVFLASDAARWITGDVIFAAGGHQ
ncbi:SDR family oxidoreductase [Actinoplanes sp. NBRC 103695]|uniref:SDR family NAD(P)-dependent oxidoreductase n=1 Tax=Actinoplanes sp. NBRC 103695 TaxID=3032202 RepID=UPI0024A0A135|nr:SDR family oxidoreductase [Actinoplanes sp. NBRC 103695]GLZ01770.1 oxidoreductase [Actinoplanes sp. NBRC 103695]